MKKIVLAVFIFLFVFACSNPNIEAPTRRATPQGTTATAQGVR